MMQQRNSGKPATASVTPPSFGSFSEHVIRSEFSTESDQKLTSLLNEIIKPSRERRVIVQGNPKFLEPRMWGDAHNSAGQQLGEPTAMQQSNDTVMEGGIPADQVFVLSGGSVNPKCWSFEFGSAPDMGQSGNEDIDLPEPSTEEPGYVKVKGAYFDGARERIGNNRQHIKPHAARKKRKSQRVARRQNRAK